MFLLGILALLAGMVLGQRFNVLTLILANFLVLFAVVVAGAALADSAWIVIVAAALTIVCLQSGYLFGLGIRHLLLLARARRLRATEAASSAAMRRAAR
jgi:hypothetical protein